MYIKMFYAKSQLGQVRSREWPIYVKDIVFKIKKKANKGCIDFASLMIFFFLLFLQISLDKSNFGLAKH